MRWAATPKFRYKLHEALEAKLARIAKHPATMPKTLNNWATSASKAIIVSGVAAAHTREILKDLALWDTIALYQVVQPFPLHEDFITTVLQAHDELLVIEETMPVIEMQLADHNKVRGKITGDLPRIGELLPEQIEAVICQFAEQDHKPVAVPTFPGRRPTLCAGCPHRAAFYAIKKAARKGIYTSDIGCYTLGLNLGAVDTVLCMGAAISQAAGFASAYRNTPDSQDIMPPSGIPLSFTRESRP